MLTEKKKIKIQERVLVGFENKNSAYWGIISKFLLTKFLASSDPCLNSESQPGNQIVPISTTKKVTNLILEFLRGVGEWRGETKQFSDNNILLSYLWNDCGH